MCLPTSPTFVVLYFLYIYKQPCSLTIFLQALFRPVSMAAPDLALICEIMLMSEGFQQAKLLARKFIILYKLCEDLLSKVKTRAWELWITVKCTQHRRSRLIMLPPAASKSPARSPSAEVTPLRLEIACHQDDIVRGRQHEACRA